MDLLDLHSRSIDGFFQIGKFTILCPVYLIADAFIDFDVHDLKPQVSRAHKAQQVFNFPAIFQIGDKTAPPRKTLGENMHRGQHLDKPVTKLLIRYHKFQMIALAGIHYTPTCQKRPGDKRTQLFYALHLFQIHNRYRRLPIAKKAQDLFPIVLIVHNSTEEAFSVLIFILVYRNGRAYANQPEDAVGIQLGYAFVFCL